MEIRREIDTSKAKYHLMGLNDEQFYLIESAVKHYWRFITHEREFNPQTSVGELMSKIEKMRESIITIIK